VRLRPLRGPGTTATGSTALKTSPPSSAVPPRNSPQGQSRVLRRRTARSSELFLAASGNARESMSALLQRQRATTSYSTSSFFELRFLIGLQAISWKPSSDSISAYSCSVETSVP